MINSFLKLGPPFRVRAERWKRAKSLQCKCGKLSCLRREALPLARLAAIAHPETDQEAAHPEPGPTTDQETAYPKADPQTDKGAYAKADRVADSAPVRGRNPRLRHRPRRPVRPRRCGGLAVHLQP